MAKTPEVTAVKVVDPVDKELAALGTILNTFDSVQSETRERMLRYLRSKYSREWPSTDY